MKKIIMLVTAFILLAVTVQAQSLQKFFDKYGDDERFEYVSVNKGMMNMASAFGGMAKDADKMVQKMQGLKILTLEADMQSSFAKSLIAEFDRIIETGKFESIVETRDKGERVNIYTRVIGADDADMLIINKSKNEWSCIWIKGKMTRSEMMKTFSDNDSADHYIKIN